jgi:chemotaxis protein MotB
MAIQEDPPAGVPDWIVSFGDMMSLLLCFFVLLFSMGQTEQQKFQAMAESMRQQFGHATTRRSVIPGQHAPLNSPLARLGAEEWAKSEDLENAREKRKLQGRDKQRVWTTRTGTHPTLGTAILFEEGSCELGAKQLDELKAVADQLRGKANKIEIRGHATGLPPPPGAAYRDDFELAFARAHQTMQHLIQAERIDRRRFHLNVVGKNEPVYTGSDPVSQAGNSRVEVFLLSELADDVSP